MSQENVEQLKRGVDAWNRDDFDVWIEHFDPDVEWFALMEMFRGHAGAREAWESFKGDMSLAIRFDEFRDLGESVLALGRMDGTGHTTGLSVGREFATLFTYRDAKIVEVRDFGSHAEGIEAAGLPE